MQDRNIVSVYEMGLSKSLFASPMRVRVMFVGVEFPDMDVVFVFVKVSVLQGGGFYLCPLGG